MSELLIALFASVLGGLVGGVLGLRFAAGLIGTTIRRQMREGVLSEEQARRLLDAMGRSR